MEQRDRLFKTGKIAEKFNYSDRAQAETLTFTGRKITGLAFFPS